MSPSQSLSDENQALANRINEEARRDASSQYAGKFVGIANGRVVVIADNWRDVSTHLRQIEPNPLNCCCLEASADYNSVREIWSEV